MEQHWLVCVTRLVCKLCGGRKCAVSGVCTLCRTSAALQQMNGIPSCPWPTECSRTPLQREQETLVLITTHSEQLCTGQVTLMPATMRFLRLTYLKPQTHKKAWTIAQRLNQRIKSKKQLATSFSHFYIQVISCIIVSLSTQTLYMFSISEFYCNFSIIKIICR